MTQGDFLISKININIPTFDRYTKLKIFTFELEKYEKCEIVKINFFPEYTIEVKCRGNVIGFSLIDLDVQVFEFYRKYFYDYRKTNNFLRTKKIKKIKFL